jgi:hypothetical protein
MSDPCSCYGQYSNECRWGMASGSTKLFLMCVDSVSSKEVIGMNYICVCSTLMLCIF